MLPSFKQGQSKPAERQISIICHIAVERGERGAIPNISQRSARLHAAQETRSQVATQLSERLNRSSDSGTQPIPGP